MQFTQLVQFSDPHVAAHGALAYGRIDTAACFERAIASLSRLHAPPDAVLITGDLTADGRPEEYQRLRELLAPLPCPVHLLPGNHDDRGALHAAFPGLPGGEGAPGLVQYAVPVGALRLVCLDTTVPGQPHGELCATRLDWLDDALRAAPGVPTIVAMHHPPFVTGIAHMDRMGLKAGGDELAALLQLHPQVQRLACGHLHRPIQARFGGTLAQTAPSTAHQIHLDLAPDARGAYTLEPPGGLLHVWHDGSLVTHQMAIDAAPGPFPFR
jgi:Icc protein